MTLREMIGKRVLTMTKDHIRNRSFPVEWRVEDLSPKGDWVGLRRIDQERTLYNPKGEGERAWRKAAEFESSIVEVLADLPAHQVKAPGVDAAG